MSFEPNQGQTDPSVAFLARGTGYAVFLRPSDATIVLTRHQKPSKLGERISLSRTALRMTLIGASDSARGEATSTLPGKVNYLIGNDRSRWRTGIPTFRSARFTGIYPGVDVVYYGTQRNLQYDFVVKPGGSVDTIRLAFEGAQSVSRSETGDLQVRAGEAELRFSRPVAYQEVGGIRKPVSAEWSVAAGAEKAPVALFMVGDYDRSRPLVIDPLLWYSTYLGGSLNDDCLDIDVDQTGCAYVTGATDSPDFPVTPGSFQTVFNGGNMDAFVTKLDPMGQAAIYSTYLGSAGDDIGFSICVDVHGQAHVAGFTDNPGFPVTPGCFDPLFNGQRDAFASILDPVGITLVYSTFIGGQGNDEAREIRLTGRLNNFAITGGSDSGNYPVTGNAFDTTWNGGIDVVYTEISPAGAGPQDLFYSTYIGSNADELGLCMDIGSGGAAAPGTACIGGWTSGQGFPLSKNPFQPFYAGNGDGFVVHLDPMQAGPAGLLYSSYIGGADPDEVRGIAWDPNTQMMSVTGMTKSPNFPVVLGGMQMVLGGGQDAFISTIRPVNGGLPDLFVSTFVGGQGDDYGNDIAMDNTEPWIVGTTMSGNFPVTAGAIQPFLNGPSDAFVMRALPLLNAPLYSTFWGGEAAEEGWGIRLDQDANAFICGSTQSQAFPVTPGCFDPTANGNNDGWVSKLGIGRATDTIVNPASGRPGDTVNLAAQLTYCWNGAPVSGKTMDFDIDGTPVGSAPTDGTGWAKLSIVVDEGSGAGNRTITASFAGDATAGPSRNSNTLTVTKAPTSVYVADRTGTITEPVELRAWLKRTTDGAWVVGRTITFKIDGTTVGTGVTSGTGRATYNWVITAGSATRTITGDFAGDAAYLASSGTGTLTCQSWSTKMYGVDRDGPITAYRVLRAWLYRLDSTPVVGKLVDFYIDGTHVGSNTTIFSGRAQVGYTIQDDGGAGTRTILADWPGDAGYGPSSARNTLTVRQATPYIWVHPRRVPLGGIANLYAYFRRLADYQPQTSKSVDFKIDGTIVQSVVTDGFGIARYAYQTVEPLGPHTIRCEFYGDAYVAAGYGEASLTIY
jgi:hypothetical protein